MTSLTPLHTKGVSVEDLADKVYRLAVSKKSWELLAREMLATITADGNKHLFVNMPEDWDMIVKSWINHIHIIESEELNGSREDGK